MNKQNVNVQMPDVKKVLGNPKITFVLGGPASGKGTQCAKLVEEFGYTHISTGDLFRAEVAKGSREGEMMKRIMNEGGLIPYQLTVQVLVNALIANPSKNYLIDGFPRALDQAIYFEQVVGEAQSVLYFNTPLEVCVARCMERAKTSGRSDDTEETIQARLRTYQEQSQAVVEMYKKFGKVREVDGSGDVIQVWQETRKAMLPQINWIVGPKISGKQQLGHALATRTNAKLLRFNNFVKEHGLQNSDDDTVVLALIQQLALEISPRVLIADFPQNTYQAQFFIKNSVAPSRVFVLHCSKDTCQERMIQIPQSHPNYMPSALLSKSIAKYNENLKDLIQFLRRDTALTEVNTEHTFASSFKEVCAVVEPTIINVRSSGSDDATAAANNIMAGLSEQGFITLNVKELIELEVQRETDAGSKIKAKGGDVADPDLIIDVLRRIIYCGIDGHNKFLLVGFPDEIKQAQIFEKHCAMITAIVYTTAKGQPTVEVKGNDLSQKNIDTIFSKQFRLKTMIEWDANTFEGHLGKKVSWGMFTGRSFSGKKTLATELSTIIMGKQVSMAQIAEELKKKMGTEEEPFEGDVPLDKVEAAICDMVAQDRAAGHKYTYVYSEWLHQSAASFIEFMTREFGLPSFYIHAQCDKKTAEERWKKKNEAEEVSEDGAAELEDSAKKTEKQKAEVEAAFASSKSKMRYIAPLSTDGSLETTLVNLRGYFAAKVIIVNHEKQLNVDTTASNLAIKYNMLYLSVYQLIKAHIKKCTEIGKALQASKKPKALSAQTKANDSFQEHEYSAVHFDMELVIKLIQATIAEKRTNQQFILLEGLCNNRKLTDEDDKLSLRYMDELFQIERHIGEVSSVISLQYEAEPTQFQEDTWEKFEEPPAPEVKPKVLNDDGEEVEEEAPADEEPPKPKWNPAEYKWTVTNRHAKNLPQLFRDYKGINCLCEERTRESFAEKSDDAVTKCLDDFCQRVLDDHKDNTVRYIYQQVIFPK